MAEVRLAELVAALSLGVDLGFGQPMEHVLRECMIALRLADRLGLEEAERSTVYYTALLVNVGCHADAHEQAKWFGDDINLRSGKYDHDIRSIRAAATAMSLIGSGNPPLHRFRVGLEFAISGHRDLDGMIETHAALARGLAERLGLPQAVQAAVGSSYEQWDGKGWPGDLAGEHIPVASRLSQFAEFVEVAHRLGGIGAAVALAERRAGSQFDPSLAETLRSEPEAILGELDSAHTWSAVIDAEPTLRVTLSGGAFDQALLAIADFVDLKSPYTLGHARAVAELAAATATQLGLPEDEVSMLRRAGLVHDLGRLGVSNAIWDKPGPLGAGEWERVRLHPYLTERMLYQSTALAPLAEVAVQHRERLDGSGYPKGLSGGAIIRPARILGAVDAYQSMREPRPHRPALSPDKTAAELQADARAGKLDAEAVAAVLVAAGHEVGRRREWPAGLTTREIDVLRLVARGLSSKQIATQLVITPKTARNHIEHIYTKIGASSRVAASLFATEHGLL
ncbi:MAG TPA: HD domain-containing phosphohydrolase [Gaiellaceae bacterium]|nr:HD domain-containing phosphohydrolase [Gaiellaceae bacterium]